jgi:hypothetical protein
MFRRRRATASQARPETNLQATAGSQQLFSLVKVLLWVQIRLSSSERRLKSMIKSTSTLTCLDRTSARGCFGFLCQGGALEDNHAE